MPAIINDLKVTTNPTVRFAYASVFTPTSSHNGDTERYKVTVMIPNSDEETISAINTAVNLAIEKGKETLWNEEVPANLRLPLRDGSTHPNPEFEGYSYIQATANVFENENQNPKVIDIYGNQITRESRQFYSGCYGAIVLEFYPYQSIKTEAAGIGCTFTNIIKTADGERFGKSKSRSHQLNDPTSDFAHIIQKDNK